MGGARGGEWRARDRYETHMPDSLFDATLVNVPSFAYACTHVLARLTVACSKAVTTKIMKRRTASKTLRAYTQTLDFNQVHNGIVAGPNAARFLILLRPFFSHRRGMLTRSRPTSMVVLHHHVVPTGRCVTGTAQHHDPLREQGNTNNLSRFRIGCAVESSLLGTECDALPRNGRA